jgi:Ca-activated chloride channel family protein
MREKAIMHRRINRILWSAMAVACLIYLFNPYLKRIYAQNSKDVHLILKENKDTASATKAADEKSVPPKPRRFTVGVSVDLVMMYTSVFDEKGRFISGLRQEDFKVYEDGVRQEISSFSQEDTPISMGIVIDLSGSMEEKMDQVNQAALAFIKASNPQDETFLIGFNDEVELLQGFTNDIDEITDALENAVVFGGTALYDAIYLGVEEAHKKGTREKKAIIVISDGEDLDSVYTLSELVKSVHASDVQVFCIGIVDELPKRKIFRLSKSEKEKYLDAMERISEESGGKAYFIQDVSGIHGIVSEIAAELRNQYSIGYISSNDARDGTWRRVVIKLDGNKDARIQHRNGYYAPSQKFQPDVQ